MEGRDGWFGPLRFTSEAIVVSGDRDWTCRLDAVGISGTDGEGDKSMTWDQVLDLKVSTPTGPRWLWPVAAAIALLAPSGFVRPPRVLVYVTGRSHRIDLDLGQPLDGRRDLGTANAIDALLEILGERGEYQVLGEPDRYDDLLEWLMRSRSWSEGWSVHLMRRAVAPPTS